MSLSSWCAPYFPRWSQVTAAVAALLLIGFAISPYAPHHEAHKKATESTEPEVKPDERIARYTLGLAWFTGVLAAVAIAQAYFLIRADKTARIAANAATEAARA